MSSINNLSEDNDKKSNRSQNNSFTKNDSYTRERENKYANNIGQNLNTDYPQKSNYNNIYERPKVVNTRPPRYNSGIDNRNSSHDYNNEYQSDRENPYPVSNTYSNSRERLDNEKGEFNNYNNYYNYNNYNSNDRPYSRTPQPKSRREEDDLTNNINSRTNFNYENFNSNYGSNFKYNSNQTPHSHNNSYHDTGRLNMDNSNTLGVNQINQYGSNHSNQGYIINNIPSHIAPNIPPKYPKEEPIIQLYRAKETSETTHNSASNSYLERVPTNEVFRTSANKNNNKDHELEKQLGDLHIVVNELQKKNTMLQMELVSSCQTGRKDLNSSYHSNSSNINKQEKPKDNLYNKNYPNQYNHTGNTSNENLESSNINLSKSNLSDYNFQYNNNASSSINTKTNNVTFDVKKNTTTSNSKGHKNINYEEIVNELTSIVGVNLIIYLNRMK